jgi:hypothetical protein
MSSKENDRPLELYFRGSSRVRVLGRIYGSIVAIIFVLFGIAYVSEPQPHLSAGRTVLAGIVWAVGSVVSVACIERIMVKPYVRATPSGLCIYNGLRTHMIQWTEVAGFEPSSRPFQIAVKRINGKPVSMTGVMGGWFGNREPQREKIRELEAYWRRMIGEQGPGTA